MSYLGIIQKANAFHIWSNGGDDNDRSLLPLKYFDGTRLNVFPTICRAFGLNHLALLTIWWNNSNVCLGYRPFAVCKQFLNVRNYRIDLQPVEWTKIVNMILKYIQLLVQTLIHLVSAPFFLVSPLTEWKIIGKLAHGRSFDLMNQSVFALIDYVIN